MNGNKKCDHRALDSVAILKASRTQRSESASMLRYTCISYTVVPCHYTVLHSQRLYESPHSDISIPRSVAQWLREEPWIGYIALLRKRM